ncbi:hypothetical protein AB0G02_30180, partial [Actinosynnema sp. NPDC023658]|uniref:SPW repeat domain-containing protein n=1 Tax=Actinosynnema sp. NPDC023658 TaxID=3155465 RepID=UPI0033D519A9
MTAPRSRAATIAAPSGALAFLVGLWLLMSPFALGYGEVGSRITGHVSDILSGSVVVVVALVGMMAPSEAPWTGPLLFVAGCWIAATPVVLGYLPGVDDTAATVNDVAAGGLVALLGAVAAPAVLSHRRGAEVPR